MHAQKHSTPRAVGMLANGATPLSAPSEIVVSKERKGISTPQFHLRRTLRLVMGMLAALLLLGLCGQAHRAQAEVPAVTIYEFGSNFDDGFHPTTLLQGKDGKLYGTTEGDPTLGGGTIFRMDLDGSHFQVLHTFDFYDQSMPISLIQGPDGTLYGTAVPLNPYSDYDLGYHGYVFSLNPDGSNFQEGLHFFNGDDGAYPDSLVLGNDGLLYGTCRAGGSNRTGTIFALATDGSSFTKLYDFSALNAASQNPDGAAPSHIIQANNGLLVVTTYGGGNNGNGTIFCCLPFNLPFNFSFTFPFTLYTFSATNASGQNYDGVGPSFILQGQDGYFYGICYGGGSSSHGTLFRLDPTGLTVLHAFSGRPDGDEPVYLLQAADGTLYGTTFLGGVIGDGVVYRISPYGTGFQVIHSFDSNVSPGMGPGPLIQANDGCLYGECTLGDSVYRIGPKIFYILPNVIHIPFIPPPGNPVPPFPPIGPGPVSGGIYMFIVGSGLTQDDIVEWAPSDMPNVRIPIDPIEVSRDGRYLACFIPSTLLTTPGIASVQVYDPDSGLTSLPPDPCYLIGDREPPRLILRFIEIVRRRSPTGAPGAVTIYLQIRNVGPGTAYNVLLNSAQLTDSSNKTFKPLGALPIPLGNMAPNTATFLSLTFPSSVSPGNAMLLVKGSYVTGLGQKGTFGGSAKLKVP